jgi:hypothetical protein
MAVQSQGMAAIPHDAVGEGSHAEPVGAARPPPAYQVPIRNSNLDVEDQWVGEALLMVSFHHSIMMMDDALRAEACS